MMMRIRSIIFYLPFLALLSGNLLFGITVEFEDQESTGNENEDGLEQVRLTINTFREVEYIHLRKYYLDFNEEWQPSSKGIAMPLNLSNSYELFAALVEILSLAESKDTIMKHFGKIFNEVYNSS